MSGLYLHIPFCKQACTYCNFHFSTTGDKASMLHAMRHEIKLQHTFLKEPLQSIYLGGGTPSILSASELSQLFDTIHAYFSIAPDAEITMEANPDDLLPEKLRELQQLSINRFSIGVQSFHDNDLRFMNRAHSSRQALDSIKLAQDYGFSNMSIDLIYGVPGLTNEAWHHNLEQTRGLEIPHLSCYALTVEPKTRLAYQVRKEKITMPGDDLVEEQFKYLLRFARASGYDHYEISNFCQEGYMAVHNTSYWRQRDYLGIGPSAHSFDGASRYWNVANNSAYVKSLTEDILPREEEVLDLRDHYNEYILTGLRTKWGCQENKIKHQFHPYYEVFTQGMASYLSKGWVVAVNGCYLLTDQGKLFADRITSDLFAV